MKIVKRILIITTIILIQSLKLLYKIICFFWKKYNKSVKEFLKKLDIELRNELI